MCRQAGEVDCFHLSTPSARLSPACRRGRAVAPPFQGGGIDEESEIMKLKIFIIASALLVSSLFFLSDVTAVNLKDQINQQLNVGGESSGLKPQGSSGATPQSYLVGFIQINLAVFGILFIILVVIAGYWLITSHNEPDKVEKAKKIITGAIIGLIIVLFSYSITRFVGQKAIEATKFGEGLEEAPELVHCCKVCEVGGIIERGCQYQKVDRAACRLSCDPDHVGAQAGGDCEYLGRIPEGECR